MEYKDHPDVKEVVRIITAKLNETKFLILSSKTPMVIEAVDSGKATPENILGCINNNVITFIPRDRMSLSDYKFMIFNADEKRGFEINIATIYQF